MRVEQRCGYNERLHYLYLHEAANGVPKTNAIAHIPPCAGDVRAWITGRFFRKRRIDPAKGGFKMRVVNASEQDRRHRVHALLTAFLCAGLGSKGRAKLFLDHLGVPERRRRSIGPKFGGQQYGVSRLIDREARRTASRDEMPALSSFRRQDWQFLATNWELAEYEYRIKRRTEYQSQRTQIESDYSSSSELPAQLAKFDGMWKEYWRKAAEGRPGLKGEFQNVQSGVRMADEGR